MSNRRIHMVRVLPKAFVAACAVALLSLLSAAQPVDAAGMKPTAGHWCGLTDAGEAVHFDVSSDARWLSGVRANTSAGNIAQSEFGRFDRVGIHDGKWILKANDSRAIKVGNGSSRKEPIRGPICRQAPCSGKDNPRQGTVYARHEFTIRGTFTNPDSMRGTFTLFSEQPRIVGSGSRARVAGVERKRAVGTYTAWPTAVAPCP